MRKCRLVFSAQVRFLVVVRSVAGRVLLFETRRRIRTAALTSSILRLRAKEEAISAVTGLQPGYPLGTDIRLRRAGGVIAVTKLSRTKRLLNTSDWNQGQEGA